MKELEAHRASPAEKHAELMSVLSIREYLIGGILWTIFLLGHPRSDNYLMHYKAASNDPELINPPRRVNDDSTIGRYM